MPSQAQLRGRLMGRGNAAVGVRDFVEETGKLGTVTAVTSSALQIIDPDVDSIVRVGEASCAIATARTSVPVQTRVDVQDILSRSSVRGKGTGLPHIEWREVRKALAKHAHALASQVLRKSPGPDTVPTAIDTSAEDRHMMHADETYEFYTVAVTAKQCTYFDVTTRAEMQDASVRIISYPEGVHGGHSSSSLGTQFSGDLISQIDGREYNIHVTRYTGMLPHLVHISGSTWDSKSVQSALGDRGAYDLMAVFLVFSPPGQRQPDCNDAASLLSTCMTEGARDVHHAAMRVSSFLHMFRIMIVPMGESRFCVSGRSSLHPTAIPGTVLRCCTKTNIVTNSNAMNALARREDPRLRPLQSQFVSAGNEHTVARVALVQLPKGAVPVLTEPGISLDADGPHDMCVRHIPEQLRSLPCTSVWVGLEEGVTIGHLFVSHKMLSLMGMTAAQSLVFLSHANPGARHAAVNGLSLVREAERVGADIPALAECVRNVDILGVRVAGVPNAKRLSAILAQTRWDRSADPVRGKIHGLACSGYVVTVGLLEHMGCMERLDWEAEWSDMRRDEVDACAVFDVLECMGRILSEMCEGDLGAELPRLGHMSPLEQPEQFLHALLRFCIGIRAKVRAGAFLRGQLILVRVAIQAVWLVFAQRATCNKLPMMSHAVSVAGVHVPLGMAAYHRPPAALVPVDIDLGVLQLFNANDVGETAAVDECGNVSIGGRRRAMRPVAAVSVEGVIRSVTDGVVEVGTMNELHVLEMPPLQNAVILDGSTLDEILLGSLVERAHAGPRGSGASMTKMVYQSQRCHSSREFVDTQTRDAVVKKTSAEVGVLSNTMVVVSGIDLGRGVREEIECMRRCDVLVHKGEFRSKDKCISGETLRLPIVNVSSNVKDIQTKLDADWMTGMATVKAGMGISDSLRRAGLLAVVAMRPELPRYAQLSVGFIALAALHGCCSTAMSVLGGLVCPFAEMSPRCKRMCIQLAMEHKEHGAYIVPLVQMAAAMHGETVSASDICDSLTVAATCDVSRCREQLDTMSSAESLDGSVQAHLCRNCQSVVSGVDRTQPERGHCDIGTVKAVVDCGVRCVECGTHSCPSCAAGSRCVHHAVLDTDEGVDDTVIWRSWLAQEESFGIVPGCMVSIPTKDNEEEGVQHVPSVCVVVGEDGGHLLLAYIDNCVPNASHNPKSADDLERMITSGSYPEVTIDMQKTQPNVLPGLSVWRLGRKVARRIPCLTRGAITLEQLRGVLSAMQDGNEECERMPLEMSDGERYRGRMRIRMKTNRAIFRLLHEPMQRGVKTIQIQRSTSAFFSGWGILNTCCAICSGSCASRQVRRRRSRRAKDGHSSRRLRRGLCIFRR